MSNAKQEQNRRANGQFGNNVHDEAKSPLGRTTYDSPSDYGMAGFVIIDEEAGKPMSPVEYASAHGIPFDGDDTEPLREHMRDNGVPYIPLVPGEFRVFSEGGEHSEEYVAETSGEALRRHQETLGAFTPACVFGVPTGNFVEEENGGLLVESQGAFSPESLGELGDDSVFSRRFTNGDQWIDYSAAPVLVAEHMYSDDPIDEDSRVYCVGTATESRDAGDDEGDTSDITFGYEGGNMTHAEAREAAERMVREQYY